MKEQFARKRTRSAWAMGALAAAGAALAALLWLMGGPAARAAPSGSTINVTTPDDELNTDGDCSLREAIQAANTDAAVDNCPAGSGADTVVLGAGTYQLSIPGAGEDNNATGDLDVMTDSLTITGLGPGQTVIDAGGLDRILDIQYNATPPAIVISGVTIFNGNVYGESGGGINNHWGADLTLINTIVLSNTAHPLAWGGGIMHSGGALTLTNASILSNTAVGHGGGLYVDDGSAAFTNTRVSDNLVTTELGDRGGGGLYLRAVTATLAGVTVTGNIAEYDGGGIYLREGSVLTQTGALLIADNVADANKVDGGSGGGLYARSDSLIWLSEARILSNTARSGGGVYLGGGARLSGTHVISNHATVNGGGVSVGIGPVHLRGAQIFSNTAGNGGGVYNAGTLRIKASAIAANRVSGDGAGLYNTNAMTVTNSTLSGNRAPEPGADGAGLTADGGTAVLVHTTVVSNVSWRCGGGVCAFDGGVVQAQNTLLAHNWLSSTTVHTVANCDSALTSNGHNLEDADTCGLTASGDITATDPGLDPLTEISGTWVHPLQPGSPAIDGGICLAGITTDQRGAARPQGATCDIGAYEAIWKRVYLPLVLRGYP